MPRVAIIGLDCLDPTLVFERFRGQLPHLESLAAQGLSGPLRSCIPPITVPAWSVMVTGRDPGVLGTYGFRDRADRGYVARRLASSLSVTAPTLWSLASRAGKRSIVLSVPQTYPPKPLKGLLVSDCMTPSHDVVWTHPEDLASRVQALTGGYMFDVAEHRHQDRDVLLADVRTMTERRFALARELLTRETWDLFMMVEMGPDRMHHAFWRYLDPTHPLHEPGHRFANAIRDYYVELDRHVGALVACLGDDDVVLVVSDHGARSMQGGFALNQWLVQRGDLVLHEQPMAPTPFDQLRVDWSRTRAWADGGYVARVYLNVAGREPQGCVSDVESYVAELTQALGTTLPETRVHRPRDIYAQVNGIAPDLIVELGGLAYRALGSVGHPSLITIGNDTGPDDANHAQHGVGIVRDGQGKRESRELVIYDVAPTVLRHLGITHALPGRAL